MRKIYKNHIYKRALFQFKLKLFLKNVKKKKSQLLCCAQSSSTRLIVVYLVDGEKNKRRKCLDRESSVVLTPTQTSQCSNKWWFPTWRWTRRPCSSRLSTPATLVAFTAMSFWVTGQLKGLAPLAPLGVLAAPKGKAIGYRPLRVSTRMLKARNRATRGYQ